MDKYVKVIKSIKSQSAGVYGPKSIRNCKGTRKSLSTFEKLDTISVIISKDNRSSVISNKNIKKYKMMKKKIKRSPTASQHNYRWKKKKKSIMLKSSKLDIIFNNYSKGYMPVLRQLG